MKKKVLIVAMRSMGTEDPAIESMWWRLYNTSKRFTWALAPAPPFATVAWARSKALSDALRLSDADVLLHVDGDMVLPAEHYEYLCATALERDAVVSGLLCKRGGGSLCQLVDWEGRYRGGKIPLYSDKLLDLDDGEYTGAAPNAFPRTVLERLAQHLPWCRGAHGVTLKHSEAQGFWPFFQDPIEQDEDGFYQMTEDRWFCRFARAHGEKVYLTLKVRCGHVGQKVYYPEDAFLEEKVG